MYLEHDVLLTCNPDGNEKYLVICTNYGSNLIKECEIEIGGQRIDKHYSHWHSVYSQLNEFNPTGYHKNGIKHIDSGGEQGTHLPTPFIDQHYLTLCLEMEALSLVVLMHYR